MDKPKLFPRLSGSNTSDCFLLEFGFDMFATLNPDSLVIASPKNAFFMALYGQHRRMYISVNTVECIFHGITVNTVECMFHGITVNAEH